MLDPYALEHSESEILGNAPRPLYLLLRNCSGNVQQLSFSSGLLRLGTRAEEWLKPLLDKASSRIGFRYPELFCAAPQRLLKSGPEE